jgi:anthranilate phosphoribosyltransferase
MIKVAIGKLIAGRNLTRHEAQAVTEEIMSGKAGSAAIASYLTALRIKGETVDEITGSVLAMRRFASRVACSSKVVLDTCGTGGDKSGTFNVSTLAAFVVAGAGITVAKHGNRSVSSSCGSADLLEALGINIYMTPERLKGCLRDVGIAFLFAPNLHPAMKYAMPVRKELGVKTIFNILGPLSNPACATHQLIGVYERRLAGLACGVLKELGSKRAMVVHGYDGLDEISTTANTYACELKGGRIRKFVIKPRGLGIKKARLNDLKGSGVASNVKSALEILKGKKGPKRDIVLLNAAAAIYVAGKAATIQDGLRLAAESLDSGRAMAKLQQLRKYSRKNK